MYASGLAVHTRKILKGTRKQVGIMDGWMLKKMEPKLGEREKRG